jgi:hypothetical protein
VVVLVATAPPRLATNTACEIFKSILPRVTVIQFSEPVTRRLDLGEIFMAKESKDKSVLNHIDQLVKEEERLYAKDQLNVDDQKRLSELKLELDQYWDLLRQRRALEEFGENPDKAKKRPAKIVENYEQ